MKYLILTAVSLGIALTAAGAVGQPPAADGTPDEDAQVALAKRLAEREASRYEFCLDDHRQERLVREPKPVLRWSNPLAGQLYGSVCLWTFRGRPEVVMSVHNWYTDRRLQEAETHSLSLGRLTGWRDGRVVWQPERGGLQLNNVPQAPPPADTAEARLRQIRSLARGFSASTTTREGVRSQLRLLPQPLFRYRPSTPDLLDGALFVFVEATDPEVFMLIEARRTQKRHRWQYGLVRFNSVVTIRVLHKHREVWSVPDLPWQQVRDRGEPYTAFRSIPEDEAD